MIRLPDRTPWNEVIGAHLSEVDRGHETPCWEWGRSRHPYGYGFVHRHGFRELAHRESVRLAGGGDPTGRVVRHRCDNPPCCRPDHLTLGTQGDNARDARDRGHTSTLTAEGVAEIRKRVAEGPRGTASAVARELGVNRATVSRIVNGRRWADVE